MLSIRTCPKEDSLPLWKRVLDVFCIFVAVPAVAPLMLMICGVIRLCSAGPVLFRQERIGLKGKPFVCLKFRTMHVQAETESHEAHLDKLINSSVPMKKLDADGDTRVFTFGRLLRASGLDELPQLINVLRGEMSLVGPRPCIRYEYERFKPEHRERFNTVPGLTGLWQVSGKNRTTFQEMIDLDIAYTRQLSLRRDVEILCRTFPVVFEQTIELTQRKMARNGNPAKMLRNQDRAKSVASL
ncbi:MAG TPA: sugar transferase [Methylomirabilota bacterium]|nr:sugar transferase [Methylomirabilota bacterium]